MKRQNQSTGCGGGDRVGSPTGGWAAVRVFVLIGAVVTISGCDDPIGVDRQSSEQMLPSSAVTVSSTPRFTSNSRKYRDTGARPVTARAGNATLSALVLKDATGRGHVQLTAGSSSGAGQATLAAVQLKGYRPDGKLVFTRNHAPGPGTATANYLVGGLSRGGRVQVQANVVGADPSRTGVVTLDAPVLLRPDLHVSAIAAPARVAARTVVGISATIREGNGDLGAAASCALIVDGAEVDRAWGIWVDAGSSVSCAFRHMFERLGPAEVMVRLVDVSPRDFDPDNNAATTMIDVIEVPSAFHFDASFRDETWESSWRSSGSWQTADGRQGSEWSEESSSSGREQHGMLWGWMPRQVSFPLDELVLQQLTRDETAHFARFLDAEPDFVWDDGYVTQSCLMRWFDSVNGFLSFELCNVQFAGDPGGSTYVYYSRNAGDVTYHSRGDSRWWDRDADMEDVWSWNYSDRSVQGRMVSYGREYSFFIRIEDANGTHRMQPLVWLEPFSERYESPWTCWDYADEWGSNRSCSESRWAGSGMRGWTAGMPTY